MKHLSEDKEIYKFIKLEKARQEDHIELMQVKTLFYAVLEAQGTLTNKYAEGYPGNRYYGGCIYVDEIENIARDRLKKLFNAKYANVQPHSGSQANAAVFQSLVKPGDVVLGMDLSAGGHLTHGHKLNFSGLLYEIHSYGVDKETEMINYDEVLEIVRKVKPKMIIAGASAYSRIIDFKSFAK